jgi:hypothetical protein
MRAARLVLPMLLLVACGGPAKAPPAKPVEKPVVDPIPTTSGPPCKAVADHMAILTVGKEDAAASKAFLKNCTEDKWSDEARSCLALTENDGELAGCAGKLTDAQRARLSMPSPKADAPDGAAPAAMSPPPPPAPGGAAPRTRAPVPKAAPPKPKGGTDPCQGGE